MSTDDHDLGEVVDLVNETSVEEAEEIIEIADDHGLDLEEAKEVKAEVKTEAVKETAIVVLPGVKVKLVG